jgi:hypothetical protein
VSHSIVQVYIWSRAYDRAREGIRQWRAEVPGNKYPLYFAPLPTMMSDDWKEAKPDRVYSRGARETPSIRMA